MGEEWEVREWRLQGFDPGAVRDLDLARPGYVDHFWLPAIVPGDVHTTLKEAGVIPDPFFGHNDQLCRWVEEKVWWYRGRFTFDRGSLQEDEVVELVFEGLDTVATVYLNGRELGRHANMFVPAVFEVTRELADGDNVVAVKFDPVSLHVREKDLTLWSAFSRERVWIRKAQMHFGWDWGPRIVPCGIWRPVRLRRYRGVRIGSVFPRTVSVTDDRARVRVDVELEGPRAEEGDGALEVHVLLRDGDRLVAEAGWTVDQGRVSGELEVTGPKLWWTHDLGEPFLYRLEVSLRRGSLELDRQEQAVGIRTVELRMQEDGESRFLFVLNGWPLFAKGANWIPVDQFVGAAPDARYVRLLESARDAGMNMIRVWGGGIYERDVFYDTCDRLGLLVWQDFMFACALYPDFNRDFVHEVEREVNTVVRRLRGRTCLALWCGNNENEWIWEMMASDGRVRTPFYGERIYYDLIPRVLRRLDPDRPYWPSSPYGGNDHNSAEEGDRHNWQVWHGHVYPRRFGEPERVDYSVEGVSFKQYLRDTARFVSEFGMHAAANRYTLERWIPEGKLVWGGRELAYRNKDAHPEKGILLMGGYTGVPETLDQYLLYSMLTQAEGLRLGVEHYRRRKFATAGALIWQLNDCWPGTSWSIMDYEGLPKAAYYYAKRFFHPYLLTVEEQGEDWILWTVWDGKEPLTDTVEVEVLDFYGHVHRLERWPVEVSPNARRAVVRVNRQNWLAGADIRDVVLVLRSLGDKTPERFVYLCDQKDMRLPEADLQAEIVEGGRAVRVRSDRHARMIVLEVPGVPVVFEDNFFDLPAGESRTVRVSADPWDSCGTLEQVMVRCVNGKPVKAVMGDGKGAAW